MAAGKRVRGMISDLEHTAGARCTPVERLLLATDGTVTHMLEALTKGDVSVSIISREEYDERLERDVVLTDEEDCPLVWARSHVNLDILDDSVADELVSGDSGIGDLLRGEYKETRREIEEIRPARADGPNTPEFVDGVEDLYLARRYSIYSDGKKIMTIWEYFPNGMF